MAERAIILSYAPSSRRTGLAALLALDDRLGTILRTTREPLLAQMRLTWWHEALLGLDDRRIPPEPTLRALALHVVPTVTGTILARQVDGWEALLAPTPDATALQAYAHDRGGRLFLAAGTLLGSADPRLGAAGEGWALADLAANLSDPATADLARRLAGERLDPLFARRWPRAARPLGALALAARTALSGRRSPDHPLSIGRLLWHRVAGR